MIWTIMKSKVPLKASIELKPNQQHFLKLLSSLGFPPKLLLMAQLASWATRTEAIA